MPRPRSHTKNAFTLAAMKVFWARGYDATSLDDLVDATGVSRHGIYRDFRGKHALFIASLDRYQGDIVSPAFSQVEADGANLRSVAAFFEQQIAKAEALGLPGLGCLVANTMTEVAPHDRAVRKKVNAHNRRLQKGFLNALRNQAAATHVSDTALGTLADNLVIFAHGLWSTSRVTSNAAVLRRSVDAFLEMIMTRIDPGSQRSRSGNNSRG